MIKKILVSQPKPTSEKSPYFDIAREFGVEFKIIDGKDEAKFVRLGILNRLRILGLKTQNPLCIDLGGASTEISNNENSQSFKFGIVRFCNEIKNDFEKNADILTQNAREFIANLKFDCVVLTSGVPTTMVALRQNLDYENYDSRKINGEILKFSEFDTAFDLIKNFDDESAKIWLGTGRKDLMISGIILLKSLLRLFQPYTRQSWIHQDFHL